MAANGKHHEATTSYDDFNPNDGGPSSNVSKGMTPAPLVKVEPIRKDDLQPSYAYFAPDAQTHSHGAYGSCMDSFGECLGALGVVPCCPCPNPYKNVRQGSVGLISKFGRFYRSVDPGLVKVNPITEDIRQVDVKIQVLPVPRQTVMTKDNVNVEIDSVIVWHIVNPYRAAFAVADVRQALSERAQTTLRTVVGGRSLQQIIVERETIAMEIETLVEKAAETWGVAVESILIKDITFSQALQESLSSAATQRRVGESKVIAARAEVDAARLMREAADILSSPAAIQIRQLEALQNMAKQANSKVVFVPMSLQQLGTVEANQLATSGAGASGQSSTQNAAIYSAMQNA